ncbi:hypothetical protein PG993_009015 [Apiospora rasikravindrae]|uniref:Uncharacterized protein n=1 Tax=Apiospora rasikravindrae TaxID=990691 RepID=A0ABR1SI65_9PEZI
MQQSSGLIPILPASSTTLIQSTVIRPTIAEINAFLQSLLPIRQGDVAFDYHTPRSRFFNPATAMPARVVLSITPTPGFYDALTRAVADSSRPTPWAFLHRPWMLDRRRVPRGTTIVSSHKAFDEVLTVGNNEALAAKLGMDVARSAVIQGYKGDPDRTIAIVGPLQTATDRAALKAQLNTEFGSFEGIFGFDDKGEKDEELATSENGQSITCVAIMNAFHPEEVCTVAEMAFEMGLTPDLMNCRSVLYLTGAVREPGLEAARKKCMAVVCVGHRTCEEWGIRHLAGVFRERWPGLQVEEVLEAEEPRVVKDKEKVQSTCEPVLGNVAGNEIHSNK